MSRGQLLAIFSQPGLWFRVKEQKWGSGWVLYWLETSTGHLWSATSEVQLGFLEMPRSHRDKTLVRQLNFCASSPAPSDSFLATQTVDWILRPAEEISQKVNRAQIRCVTMKNFFYLFCFGATLSGAQFTSGSALWNQSLIYFTAPLCVNSIGSNSLMYSKN